MVNGGVLEKVFLKKTIDDLNEMCKKITCKQAVKEKILSRLLMKLVRKEINKIETSDYLIKLSPYNDTELWYIDKTSFKLRDDFIPMYTELKNDSK